MKTSLRERNERKQIKKTVTANYKLYKNKRLKQQTLKENMLLKLENI